MGELNGRVALVTGGSKGIGFETSKLLANRGAKVVIVGRDENALISAMNDIGPNIDYFGADVSKLEELDRLFEYIEKKYGKIDILFANAGCAERIWIGEVSEEDFDKMVQVNYKGTYFTVQKSIPHIKEGGSIILNASIAGIFALDCHTIYSSSKAALIQLAKTLAADLAPQKIRVNSISPGYIKTPIWDKWFNEDSKKFKALCETVPLEKRFGTTRELANVVFFLASSLSSYITAQNLVVDGGLTSIVQEFGRA